MLGFAELKRQIGDQMGVALECEHFDSATGDTLQQTTSGLAVYRSDGTLRFTDGWRHWALDAGGMVQWMGADAEPPASTPSIAMAPRVVASMPSVAPGDLMRIVHTDGLGVVLRSAPRTDARLPAGFLEGTLVTLVEHQDEWARVRGPGRPRRLGAHPVRGASRLTLITSASWAVLDPTFGGHAK